MVTREGPRSGWTPIVGTTSTGDPNLVATTFFHRADIPRTLDFIEAVTNGEGIADTGTKWVTESQLGPVDLDIKQFKVSKNVRLGRSVKVELVVKNTGDVDNDAQAVVTGQQNSAVVHIETMMVSDAVGGGHTRWSFSSYTPTATGDINWTATITDADPDDDTAIATTSVR
jgi:hypothetical protein